jgi:peptidoglycan/LPS O-acetylase OafA/YrhL
MLSTTTGTSAIAVSDAYVRFRGQRHFGSLDGLRALAVIAVIWHHTVGHVASFPMLLGRGAHGVTLFFAISGFLIVTLLLREWDRTGRIDLRAFYLRRTLRIFPLYFAVLGLYIVLVVLLERHSTAGRDFLHNLPAFITYTSNWFVALDGRVIFYFAWSLAAEEQFYLVWPTLQKWLKPARSLAVMALIIAVVAWMQSAMAPADPASSPLWFRMLASIQLAICFGVVLAHLLHHPRSHAWLGWLFGWRISSMVFLMLALTVLAAPSPAWAIHLSLALLVGACVYREDHVLAPLLQWRVLAHVGSVSYGMYLMHMLVKNAVGRMLSPLGLANAHYLVFALTVLGVVVVASLSYRYFESYFLRYKESLSSAAARSKGEAAGGALVSGLTLEPGESANEAPPTMGSVIKGDLT